MYQTKMSQQQNKHYKSIREYSVELGLRTHRPSAFSPSYVPVKDSSLISLSSNHLTGGLSTCSNTPQCGELGDWWDLPSSSSVNYEQKIKTVRVSYSADEIYGRAQATQPATAVAERRDTNYYAEQRGNSDNDTYSGAKYQSQQEEIISGNEKQHGQRRFANLKTRLADRSSNANKYTYQGDISTPSSNFVDNGHHNNFLSFQHQTEHNNGITSSEHSSHLPPRHAWESASKPNLDLDGITFRTFEEAMKMYPSDDESSENSYIDEPSLMSKSELTNERRAYLLNKPTIEKKSPKSSSNNVYPDIPPPEYEPPAVPLAKKEMVNTRDKINETVSCMSKVTSHTDLKTYLPKPIQPGANTRKEELNDVDAHSVLQTLMDKPEFNQISAAEDDVPSLNLQNSQTDSAIQRASMRRLTSLEEENLCGSSFSKNSHQVLDANVPPIDLGLLSPKKSKSAPAVQKTGPRKSASTIKSRSVNLQTSQPKKYTPSIKSKSLDPMAQQPTKAKSPRTLSDDRSNNSTKHYRTDSKAPHTTSKSFNSAKTSKIAQEIKNRVQKSPVEIAKEIKRRVQSQKSSADTIKQSVGAEVTSKARTESKDYLKLDNHILSSRTSSILSSFRGYDKYIDMSPRIVSGELSIWQCLPEEIWLLILSFLPITDLHSFMMCCHDFNRIAHDRSLWRSVNLYKKELSDNEIIKIGHLRPISLSIVQCSGVKVNGDSVSNRGLREMFTMCGSNLDFLSVASCVMPPLSGEAMLHHAVLHCAGINTLDLSWCNLTDHDIDLVSNSFTGLKAILLNGNQALTDISVGKLISSLSLQLESVEVQGCFKLTNRTLIEIGKCSNLLSLNLAQCHKFSSSQIMSDVRQLRNIESLGLKGLKQVRDSCVTEIVKSCRNITSLIISQCTSLTSKSLVEISCALSDLTSLEASSCKQCVNDTSTGSLLTNCKSLSCLDLSSTPITNLTLQYLSTHCHLLSDLKLNFCSVTDAAVKDFIVKCESLRKLQLYGVKSISVEELSELNSQVVVEN